MHPVEGLVAAQRHSGEARQGMITYVIRDCFRICSFALQPTASLHKLSRSRRLRSAACLVLSKPKKNQVATLAHNKMTLSLDKVVLVDMDNTLVDFDLEFGKRWVAARPEDTLDLIKSRKNFELEQNFSPELKPLAIKIMSEPGFFNSFAPQPYAVEAMKEMTEAGLHVLLCTAPLPFQWETCVAEKYAWVRRHLGEEFLSRIIITRDKTVIKGRLLIDDKPRVAGACNKPEWTHIVFDQPYNQEVEDKMRLKSWREWRSVVGAYMGL